MATNGPSTAGDIQQEMPTDGDLSTSSRNNNNDNNSKKRKLIPEDVDADTTESQPLQKRLKARLANDKMTDLILVGDDGVPVPAVRYVLACASPVLQKLCYGEFAESTKSTLTMKGYTCKTLKALVGYCFSDELDASLWVGMSKPQVIQELIDLAKIGDQYGIAGISSEIVQFHLKPMLDDCPQLACVAWNGSDSETTPAIEEAALAAIKENPQVALKWDRKATSSSGGIAALDPSKLEKLVTESGLSAQILFQLLLDWRDSRKDTCDEKETQEICEQLAPQLDLSYINPQELDNKFFKSGLVGMDQIMETYRDQALMASSAGLVVGGQYKVQGIDLSRCSVIVQGAGNPAYNGVYNYGPALGVNQVSFYMRDATGQVRSVNMRGEQEAPWWAMVCSNTIGYGHDVLPTGISPASGVCFCPMMTGMSSTAMPQPQRASLSSSLLTVALVLRKRRTEAESIYRCFLHVLPEA